MKRINFTAALCAGLIGLTTMGIISHADECDYVEAPLEIFEEQEEETLSEARMEEEPVSTAEAVDAASDIAPDDDLDDDCLIEDYTVVTEEMPACTIEADTEPPRIHTDTLLVTLPEGKDTATDGDSVVMSVKATDASGVKGVNICVINTESGKATTVELERGEDDLWQGSLPITQQVASGKWQVGFIAAGDTNQNSTSVYNLNYVDKYGTKPYSDRSDAEDLSAWDFTVEGTNPDLDPPQVNVSALQITLPEGKDTVTDGDIVEISVEATDASGVRYVFVYIKNDEANKSTSIRLQQKGGDLWQGTFPITQQVASGKWQVYYIESMDIHQNQMQVRNRNYVDKDGQMPYSNSSNAVEMPAADFTVEETLADTDPPQVNVSTLQVKLPDGKDAVMIGDTVEISIEITDATLVQNTYIYFMNAGVQKSANVFLRRGENNLFQGSFSITEQVASGRWQVTLIVSEDANQNTIRLYNLNYVDNTGQTPYSSFSDTADLSAGDFTVADCYKVTFDTRGGNEIASQYILPGETASEPEKPVQGSGIWQDGSFVDWYAGAELTRKYDFNAPVTEDITLYAKWRYPFSVCAYDRTNSADYDGGQYMVLGENLPERMRSGGCNLNAVEGNITFTAYPAVGYVFAGWYKGEYAGMVDDSHTMVSRPLDMEDSANLLSADREFTYPLNGYAVICAVFEKCTSHNWEQHIEKATPDENGYIYSTCSFCREETAHAPLLKVDHIALSALSGTSFTYTGKAIRPGVTVANGEGALPADVYTVTYLNNVNAGTATARVTLRGDYYTGTKDLTFTIGKAPNTLTVKGRTVKLKASKVKKKNQTVKVSKAFGISSAQGSVKFKKISGSKKIKVAANGRFTVRKGLKKGTYKIKVQVTAAGGANYAPGTKTVTVKIRIK